MSLKDQLIKAGIISEKEANEKEQQFKNEADRKAQQLKNEKELVKQKQKSQQVLKDQQDNSAFFFYKRKQKECLCPLCKNSIGNNVADIPYDIIKIDSFLELNNIVMDKKQSYAIANKIVRDHLDKVVSFTIKFNNGKVRVSICAECISNHFMNTKYFFDPKV